MLKSIRIIYFVRKSFMVRMYEHDLWYFTYDEKWLRSEECCDAACWQGNRKWRWKHRMSVQYYFFERRRQFQLFTARCKDFIATIRNMTFQLWKEIVVDFSLVSLDLRYKEANARAASINLWNGLARWHMPANNHELRINFSFGTRAKRFPSSIPIRESDSNPNITHTSVISSWVWTTLESTSPWWRWYQSW